MKTKTNAAVRLLTPLLEEGLDQGDVGVVVAEFFEPEDAYEVEFCDDEGRTVAQVALRPEQIEVVD